MPPVDTVRARLQLIVRYWDIPKPEGRALLYVLQHSPCSRATVLRRHLVVMDVVVPTTQGARETDAQHLFAQIITLRFLLALVADLRSAGQLTPAQVRVIERANAGLRGPPGPVEGDRGVGRRPCPQTARSCDGSPPIWR